MLAGLFQGIRVMLRKSPKKKGYIMGPVKDG